MYSFPPEKLPKTKGVSLIELVLVTAAVGFLALLVAVLPNSIALVSQSRNLSIAKSVASKQIDRLRKMTFGNLGNGTTAFTDPQLDRLSGVQAVYEVGDCPGSVCSQPLPLKLVKVKITWQEAKSAKTVEQSTLIGEGGLGQ